jgi:hypothetical protein
VTARSVAPLPEWLEKTYHVVEQGTVPGLVLMAATAISLTLANCGATSAWWLGLLFGQGHAAAVRRWTLWMLENGDADALLRSHAHFRVLCHRVAFECKCETAFAALRRTYADAKARTALSKQDASFAAGFDLTPYGGP